MDICFYCGGNHRSSNCMIHSHELTRQSIQKAADGYTSSSREMTGEISACINYNQELTRQSVQNMTNKFESSSREISSRLSELTDVFSYSHAEQMWHLEKQTNVLKEIRDNLIEIRFHWDNNRSNEQLEMSNQSLKRGMITECLRCANKALEYNPLDHRTYITMGHAYLRMDDFENAIDRFEYAERNAPTEYYKSYSLLLMSRVYFCKGDVRTAIEKVQEAIALSPDYSDARYQYSAYIAANMSKRLRG